MTSIRLLHTHTRNSQKGFSLVELLVSITIGLALMIAVTAAYLGSSNASKMAEAQGRMNEDAQAAIAVLAQQIRVAGDNPRQPMYDAATPRNPVFPSGTYAIRGCDGTFTDVTTATDIASLTCNGGGTTAPDSLAIAYEADATNTVATTAGVPTDCLGQALTTVTPSPSGVTVWGGSPLASTTNAAVSYMVADNRFYVKTTNSIPSLYCKGSGGSEQPLVDNVEDLQFKWGLAAPNSTNMTLTGYLTSATNVENDANLIAAYPDPDKASRWGRVVAVEICVLVRSENPVVQDSASAQYTKCDGTLDTNPPDLRLRRAYYSVVTLRNRMQ